MLTRRFTQGMDGPYSDLEWEYRDIAIKRPDGSTVFEQKGVHVPSTWSLNASTILAQKYFRGVMGSPERESSLTQVIHRVVQAIAARGVVDGYLVDDEQAKVFMDELSYVLAHQMASFNSPVWFNIGVEGVAQQASACFILSVDDDMESILNWYREEGLIFKGGSGSGVNLSKIRSSQELLKGGGTASGPVSFMRGADASAGTIKSGGRVRRAAKMAILDASHPDIEEFIWCKALEEHKARALRDAGFDMSLDGKDGFSVQYQNANNSVRVTDEFMEAVLEDGDWELRAVTTGKVIRTMRARDLMRQIAQAAWECADPGLQFDTTINHWHTTPKAGRINGSNPCFTGDTLVASADGRNAVRIDELVGTDTPVYAKDAKGNTVIRTMRNVRMTRSDAAIVRIHLDDGTWVDCTPDHPFMINDGSYTAASELKRGVSLKRFDSEVVRYGGESSGSMRRRVWSQRGWRWQHHLIGKSLFDNWFGQGLHLDHKDGDSLNDAPGNLQLLTAAVHRAKTNEEHMLGDANPARRLMNPSWKSKVAVAVKGSRNPRFIKVDPRLLAETYRLGVLEDPKFIAGRRKGTTAWNVYVKANDLVGIVPLARSDRHDGARIQGMSWSEFENFIESQAVPTNHKVVSVDPAGYADVFDGEVDELHNFAVVTSVSGEIRTATLSGVFVHNCAEYLSLDNSSCNLASLNLLSFLGDDGSFDVESFVHTASLVFEAQDILINHSDYPTEAITETTHSYRQLGLGYANLGALLMTLGLPYDSDGGRALAATLTALMTGVAYRTSAELAEHLGAFPGYKADAGSVLQVLEMHRDAMGKIDENLVSQDILSAAQRVWDDTITLAREHGVRNAQATLLAPTGTISFLMDCDTTGVEPAFSLVSYKKLVGGGNMVLPVQCVEPALVRLGYSESDRRAILDAIVNGSSLASESHLRREHRSVFATAVGDNSISAGGHIKMMSAVQPFLSGAISKTVNLPEETTVEEVEETYIEAWELGLKAVALYRDNCKVAQPLSSTKDVATQDAASDTATWEALAAESEAVCSTLRQRIVALEEELAKPKVISPVRSRLPRHRRSRTYAFRVGEAEGYVTVGEYDDGRPGEMFVKVSKQGSTLAGIMDALSISVSLGLQHGVPLETYVRKFTNMRFEPAGMTDDPDLRIASSLVDYIFRRVALDYLDTGVRGDLGIHSSSERVTKLEESHDEVVVDKGYDLMSLDVPKSFQNSRIRDEVKMYYERLSEGTNFDFLAAVNAPELKKLQTGTDAPLCYECGTSMMKTGSCWACPGCGVTSGCS